jgi:hypothetical protein
MCIPEDFGTDANGGQTADFCSFCFREGKFVDPDLNIQEIIDRVTGSMVALHSMPDETAKGMLRAYIPALKCWKNTRKMQRWQ